MTKLEDINIIPNATKEIILNQLTQRKDIKVYISNLTNNLYYRDELYQELFLTLCEMDAINLLDIYRRKKLNGYIVGVLNTMLKLETSPFYRKIKSFQGIIHDEETTEENNEDYIEQILHELDDSTETKHLFHEQLEIAINGLFIYNRNILKDYIELGFSIKKVSEKNKIHPNYISECLNKTKKILKTEILKQIKLINDKKY